MTHQVTATGARRGHCVRDAHSISDCNERDGRRAPLVYAKFTAPIPTKSHICIPSDGLLSSVQRRSDNASNISLGSTRRCFSMSQGPKQCNSAGPSPYFY
jgi:hypothetical protein